MVFRTSADPQAARFTIHPSDVNGAGAVMLDMKLWCQTCGSKALPLAITSDPQASTVVEFYLSETPTSADSMSVIRQTILDWSRENSVKISAEGELAIEANFAASQANIFEHFSDYREQISNLHAFLQFVTRLYLYGLRDRHGGGNPARIFPALAFTPAGDTMQLDTRDVESFRLPEMFKLFNQIWFRLMLKEGIVEVKTEPNGMYMVIDGTGGDGSTNRTNRYVHFSIGSHRLEMEGSKQSCTCDVSIESPGLKPPVVCGPRQTTLSRGCSVR